MPQSPGRNLQRRCSAQIIRGKVHMKKNRNRFLALVIALMMAAALSGCNSVADATIGPKGATINLKGLSEGSFFEDKAKFNFDEGVIKVDLESGTVDIQIVNIVLDDVDGDSYTEMDMIYEGEGLSGGDEIEVSGLKTDLLIRIYGDNATGKLTISRKE